MAYLRAGVPGYKFTLLTGQPMSAGSVSYRLVKPSGAVATGSGTIEDAATGVMSFLSDGSNNSEVGTYRARGLWDPGDGRGPFPSEEITFAMSDI
jgi:hypothetical protein